MVELTGAESSSGRSPHSPAGRARARSLLLRPGGWLDRALPHAPWAGRHRAFAAAQAQGARWLVEGYDIWDFQSGDEDRGVCFRLFGTDAEVGTFVRQCATDEWYGLAGIYDLGKPLDEQRGGISSDAWQQGHRQLPPPEGRHDHDNSPVAVAEAPIRVDRTAVRLVKFADGCGRVELWAGPDQGWVPGGDATMLFEPAASRDFLRSIGIPESDWPQ